MKYHAARFCLVAGGEVLDDPEWSESYDGKSMWDFYTIHEPGKVIVAHPHFIVATDTVNDSGRVLQFWLVWMTDE